MRLYNSKRGGSNCGFNTNAIRCFRVRGSWDSINFMTILVSLAIEKYGVGLSCDSVCTNYMEVTFRYPELDKNIRLKNELIDLAKVKYNEKYKN